MLSINTNISSLITQSSMKQSTDKLNQAIERMTTGFKINHASDNAANYSISTNMTTKIGAYNIAEDNAAMGLDLISTAEGALNQIQDKLERLRALQEQASNGTYGTQSKDAINAEANALVDEINRLYSTAEYNSIKLFGAENVESTPAIATFAMARSATTENYFIADPITYTDEEVEAMTTMTQAVAESSLVSGGTYSISTVDELVALADYVNSGKDTTGMTFVLGADIDLASISNWTPIGDYSTNSNYQFKGTFDGNGHVISNLTIDNATKDYQGLFGYTNRANIKNVGIDTCSINGKDLVGALVGVARYANNIINCYSNGEISCAAYGTAGGLIGELSSNGNMSNCYANGNVTTSGRDSSLGGLVGKITAYSKISNCYATSTVNGTAFNSTAGGLIGYFSGNGCTLTDSYASGNVTGEGYAGGLVGFLSGSSHTISNSYATGTAESESYSAGLVGYSVSVSDLSVNNCYSTSAVTGSVHSSSITNSDDWDGTEYTYGVASTPANGVVTTPDPTPDIGSDPDPNPDLTPDPDVGGDGTGGGTTPDTPSTPPSFTLAPNTILLQIGASSDWASQVGVSTKFELEGLEDLRMIGLDSTTDYLTQIDDMLVLVSEKQTHFGAVSNRLESVLEEIIIQRDNLISSRSTIRDADIAEVSSQYIQQQILQQASATLLATANQSPSIALQLI